MPTSRFESVLFDFDGTLADTLPLVLAALHAALGDVTTRRFRDEEISATFGVTEEGSLEKLVPGSGESAMSAYLHHYRRMHAMCPSPFPGIRDILVDLNQQGVFLGIVTGRSAASLEISLNEFGLKHFFGAFGSGSVERPVKPECIQRIIGENQLDPCRSLYIGDMPSDIPASREAGVQSAAAAWAPTVSKQALLDGDPDYFLPDVEALRNLVLPGK